jgi:transposase InsO family protein
LVATDYFTKWVEAEALKHIGENEVKQFLWKNIVTCFGILRSLIADNGTQFKGLVVRNFCTNLGIKQHFSSVGYPQGNGQAEASNKVIVAGLKRRLNAGKGKWAEELPSILWAFRTTPRQSTGEALILWLMELKP